MTKSADEIPVVALGCSKCSCQLAWVQTYENERVPHSCLSCGSPLIVLVGEAAANICFREAAEWSTAADVTARAAANQVRYAEALKIHGVAEQKKGEKPCA